MKIENSTAPRAARYSAPCGSRETRTAPHAVRIPEYSAPCCTQDRFDAPRTAPRADLKRVTRRSRFFPLVLCSSALASALFLHRFPCSRTTPVTLHRLHPSHMSQIAPFDRHRAHPLRALHPMQGMHLRAASTRPANEADTP